MSWGLSDYGQVADSYSASHSRPNPKIVLGAVAANFVVGIGAGWYTSYALSDQGRVYSWGANSFGPNDLGDNSGVSSTSVPVQMIVTPITTLNVSKIIVSSWARSMFIIGNNTYYGFGDNTYFKFGSGPASSFTSLTKLVPAYGNNTIFSATGSDHAAYILNGTTCYGVFDQDINVCSTHGSCVATDTCVCRTGYVGYDCLIPTCFGLNGSDPLVCSGNGTCLTIDTCICRNGLRGSQCETVVGGYLYGSGRDTNGGLVDSLVGADILELTPIYPSSMQGQLVNQVYPADENTYIVKMDGTFWGGGRNTFGELADGTTISRSTFAQIVFPNGATVVSFAVTGHLLAATSDGRIYTWGINNYNQVRLVDSSNINS